MKIRVFAAGVAAVLITGGAATVAQRVITQKTRGVLPFQINMAQPTARPVKLAIPTQPDPSPPAPQLAMQLPVADSPPSSPPAPAEPSVNPEPNHLTLPAPTVESAVAVVATAPAPPPDPAANVEPPQPLPADPAVSRATNPGASAPVDGSKGDPVETVESFLERNRKEAEAAIQDLSTEEENLKSRLAKVQTALVRWQAFSHALSADQPVAQPTQAPSSKVNWKRPEAESSAPSGRPTQPDPAPKPAEEVSPPTPVTEVPPAMPVPSAAGGDPATTPNDPKPTEPLPAPLDHPPLPNP